MAVNIICSFTLTFHKLHSIQELTIFSQKKINLIKIVIFIDKHKAQPYTWHAYRRSSSRVAAHLRSSAAFAHSEGTFPVHSAPSSNPTIFQGFLKC